MHYIDPKWGTKSPLNNGSVIDVSPQEVVNQPSEEKSTPPCLRCKVMIVGTIFMLALTLYNAYYINSSWESIGSTIFPIIGALVMIYGYKTQHEMCQVKGFE